MMVILTSQNDSEILAALESIKVRLPETRPLLQKDKLKIHALPVLQPTLMMIRHQAPAVDLCTRAMTSRTLACLRGHGLHGPTACSAKPSCT